MCAARRREADPARRIRRRDADGESAVAANANLPRLVPSSGARLTFGELQQSPAQAAPAEDHFPSISRAVLDPQGLTLVDYERGEPIIPNKAPDYIPSIRLMNENEDASAQGGYALIRKIKSLQHHAPNWGEVWCGIQFTRVKPGTFQAPRPGKFVAIKILNKQVVDAYLQHPHRVPRDTRHVDQDYLATALQVQDRENPYREMSRMDEIGDNVHVLRQIEFLQDDDFVYIITPYAVGRVSLDLALFRPHRELAPQEARSFFIQILQILAYLEEHHIHHRDLSPDNFIFLEEDRLVVMDLAMSVRIPVDPQSGRRTLIQAMGRFGTPAFMSPEIYNNFRVFDGVSADLWSAMLILYAMLANVPLYYRPDAQTDISYRYYVVAGGITQNPLNELVVEILGDVFGQDGDPGQRHRLVQQSEAHLSLTPSALSLFHHFFHINPAERWTLAQVMESDYVQRDDRQNLQQS